MMKEFGSFRIDDKDSNSQLATCFTYVSRQDFEYLAKLFPESVQTRPNGARSLHVECETTDSRFIAAWEFLKGLGYSPIPGKWKSISSPNQFEYLMRREFSEPELSEASFLSITPSYMFTDSVDMFPPDYQIIVRKKISQKKTFGFIVSNRILIIKKSALEELSEHGISISTREVLDKERQPSLDLFEITRTRMLPPLRDLIIDAPIVMDGFFIAAQLKFNRYEFDQLGNFDLAYTCEFENGKGIGIPVCSARLFQLLRKYDKGLQAIPVKLI